MVYACGVVGVFSARVHLLVSSSLHHLLSKHFDQLPGCVQEGVGCFALLLHKEVCADGCSCPMQLLEQVTDRANVVLMTVFAIKAHVPGGASVVLRFVGSYKGNCFDLRRRVLVEDTIKYNQPPA